MRGKTATKRIIPKDPLYQSRLVTKLITRSMKDGKRAVAETNIYTALELVKTKTKKDPPRLPATMSRRPAGWAAPPIRSRLPFGPTGPSV